MFNIADISAKAFLVTNLQQSSRGATTRKDVEKAASRAHVFLLAVACANVWPTLHSAVFNDIHIYINKYIYVYIYIY